MSFSSMPKSTRQPSQLRLRSDEMKHARRQILDDVRGHVADRLPRPLEPTGKGQVRWTMRWKPVLNAFAIPFGARFPPLEVTNQPAGNTVAASVYSRVSGGFAPLFAAADGHCFSAARWASRPGRCELA